MPYRRAKKECSTTILGYKAHYLHFPAQKPQGTLVCFHGWLDNAASFVPLAEELPEYEIFAWDFLGHGRSAHKHPGERYHYIDLIPFIHATLKYLNRSKIILVGHSMGAGAAALYTGSVGEHVETLILVEGLSPLTAEATEARAILAQGVRDFTKAQNLPKPVYPSLQEALQVRMRVNGLSREAALPLVKRAVKRVPGGYTWRGDFRLRAASLLRLSKLQVKNILAGIRVPALVILGDKGMQQLTRVGRNDRDLKKIFEICTLPGHHHLHLDNAAQVAAVIRDFLAGVSSQ